MLPPDGASSWTITLRITWWITTTCRGAACAGAAWDGAGLGTTSMTVHAARKAAPPPTQASDRCVCFEVRRDRPAIARTVP
jgi:hypothetical protein